MCYSREQSIKSFVINLITCYALYTYKNNATYKILALFFGFVGIMQFFDIIFWSTQDIKDITKSRINYTTTKIAMFFNHLQPIILAYLIYVFTGKLGQLSKIIITIYTIVITFYTINAYNNIKYTLRENVSIRGIEDNDTRPSLKWEWNSLYNALYVYMIFLLTLVILSYENFKYPLNIILSFINIFTFILSAYYYKGKSIGRFWCKFAAWVPLLFILFK